MGLFENSIQQVATIIKDMNAAELEKGYLVGDSSHKIEISNRYMEGKYISSVLYMLQGDLSGFNVCPFSTPSCREICLGTCSGHAAMIKKGEKTNRVQVARLRRTMLYMKHRELFKLKLIKELHKLGRKAVTKGVVPAFRFNGTSDLPFHNMTMPGNNETIMEHFGKQYGMIFYDYTKSLNKMMAFLNKELPSNYHLTFSYTPENPHYSTMVLQKGGNVAVVFDTKKQNEIEGKRFMNFPVISGDNHDLRFADPKGGYVVGLTRKGWYKSTKGFFVDKNLLTVGE